jgi:hypothetical protein
MVIHLPKNLARTFIDASDIYSAFKHTLEEKGWHVDTQLEHPDDAPLEDFVGNERENEAHVKKLLREHAQSKRVLILKNSHTGGHRYAGNCIVSFS